MGKLKKAKRFLSEYSEPIVAFLLGTFGFGGFLFVSVKFLTIFGSLSLLGIWLSGYLFYRKETRGYYSNPILAFAIICILVLITSLIFGLPLVR